MSERLLFVTGKLAERSLERVLRQMAPTPFDWTITVPGVAVAALITSKLLERRLPPTETFDRVILPGRCRGDLAALSAHFGTPFERGPEELKDLPAFFGTRATAREIGPTDLRVFAEIVDAPQLSIEAIVSRAGTLANDGADVIDLGCLPDTPFPHLEEAVAALHAAGHRVSIDSLETNELTRGIKAGADFCFSLTADTLHLVDDSDCVPILIGTDPRDLDALCRAIDMFAASGRPFYADPVLDPIHYAFTDSIVRYHELRRRYPDIEILMGIGNLSELTHTDTLGVNALLLGIASELEITAVLTTEVSAHCRTVVREVNRIRRVMYAAREDNTPPRHLDESLMVVHDRHPHPYSDAEIAEFAADVRDDNYRIQVSDTGIHIYNRGGLQHAPDPYDLFPTLGVEDDGAHAFYLGLELAKAQIAFQLGKRYEQDELLDWGCILPRKQSDKHDFAAARSTYKARKRGRR